MSSPPARARPDRSPLPGGLAGRILLRSLALQASWNPQRMQNLGLMFCLLPWLRRSRPSLTERRRFCRRHYEYFNTNPYLANFILGGLLRLEEETAGADDTGHLAIRTFRNSLTRTFASLGDQLFWLGLRPGLLFLVCLFGFLGHLWLVLAAIGLFGLGQLELRRRSLLAGHRLGLDIVEVLTHPAWHRAISLGKRVAILLAGVLGGCLGAWSLASGGEPDLLPRLGILVLGLGLPLLLHKRMPPEGLFLAAVPIAGALAFF